MLQSIFALVSLMFIGFSTYGLGCACWQGFRVREEHAARDDEFEATVWSLVLGLLIAGLLLMCLGLLGWLYVPAIRALTLGGVFYGAAIAAQTVDRAWRKSLTPPEFADSSGAITSETASDRLWSAPRWLTRGMLLLAGVASAGALFSALAPATAGDALCYHLELPKIYLAKHSLLDLPYHENGTFPLLVEMWYLWALALDGSETAQLVHWGCGLLLGAAGYLLARDLIGRAWGTVAGCLVVLVPGITNQMTAALNDIPLALFCTLSLVGWRHAAVEDRSPRWFLITGLMAGGALATKYVALLFATAMGVLLLVQLWRQPGRRMTLLRGAGVVVVIAVSVAGAWYLRAAVLRGNPVHPFFASAFGNEGRETLRESKLPLSWHPADVLTAPWQVTMQPEEFGGRGHQLGALFLLALPGLVFCRRLRGLGALLMVAALFALLWYGLRQNMRFFYPALPILAVSATWVLMEMRRMPTWPRWLASLACAGVLLVNMAFPLYRARHQLPVALGLVSRDEYLQRHEPAYQAAQFAREHLSDDAHILSQEFRGYYFPCDFTREVIFRQQTKYHRQVESPQDLAETAHKAGFTHLLLAQSPSVDLHYNSTLRRLAREAIRRSPARWRTVLTYKHRALDGTLRHFQLVELRPAVTAAMR